MNFEQKLETADFLQNELLAMSEDAELLQEAFYRNAWFLPRFSAIALKNIATQYLDNKKIEPWITQYQIPERSERLGIILAGNIPLVGFQDLWCAYFTNDEIVLKMSSKDNFLMQKILEKWTEHDADFKKRLTLSERIENIDKIIATGSNNTHRYFEYYFQKYRHILRKSRTSVAYVPENIGDFDLAKLADDVFLYSGLGCRNVSKLYVQKGANIERIFKNFEGYRFLGDERKYMNNFDYQKTLLLMNQTPHLSNDFFNLVENTGLFSPISSVFYEWVSDEADFEAKIVEYQNDIQCVVSKKKLRYGETQTPSLNDYPDNIDVMQFLIS